MCIPPGARVAVACSGGADSMALTLIAARWAKQLGSEITAITVDHGLRPDSADEAAQVKKWLKRHGIRHIILTWSGTKPKANIQETARKARYQLMGEYCKTHAIGHLLVAHHKEDQAETFLLRLARGSGVDGLAAMQSVSSHYGIVIHRPFLNIPKAELLGYLQSCKQPFVEDPSNRNEAYDRVKIRNALPLLAELGLTVDKLASTAAAMARARDALESETATLIRSVCRIYAEGYALLTPFAAPDEIALRVLSTLLMIIGGLEVKPRLEEVMRLERALASASFKGATLAGCQFIPSKEGLVICREPKAVAQATSAGNRVWDRRFTLTSPPQKGWTIGALTQNGWLGVSKAHKIISPYPDKTILYTLPALRDASGKLRAVPHLGIGECAIRFTACARFPGIILSDH